MVSTDGKEIADTAEFYIEVDSADRNTLDLLNDARKAHGYAVTLFSDLIARQENVAEAVGTKTTIIECGITQVAQRRIGIPTVPRRTNKAFGPSWGTGRQTAERMALVARDFQPQTQWALVAIPAPIYFVPRQSQKRSGNIQSRYNG